MPHQNFGNRKTGANKHNQTLINTLLSQYNQNLNLNPNCQTIKTQTLRNYRLSQKVKLLGYGEFNHLTNILTLPLMCGLRLSLNE